MRDGRQYDVPDLTWYLAVESAMKVGVPPVDDPKSRYAAYTEWVEYRDIDRIELLPVPAPTA
jgi:hypothetical protein